MRIFSAFIRPLVMCLAMALFCCHGYHHGALAADGHKAPFAILATTFPVWLFAANVCVDAEDVKLEMLVPAAAGCPHDYSPTPRDLQKLAHADIVLINGFGLEDFLDKALQKLDPATRIVDAGSGVPTLREDSGAINPHIFAAPAQAAIMAGNIARELARHNPGNASIYEANARRFQERLENLSRRLAAIGQNANNRGIALEHEALAYLAANAGLKIVAVLEGNVTASLMARLKKELLETKPALLASDSQYPDRNFRILSRETGLPFAQLNPCASGPDNAPLDYYEAVMEKNIKILEESFDN